MESSTVALLLGAHAKEYAHGELAGIQSMARMWYSESAGRGGVGSCVSMASCVISSVCTAQEELPGENDFCC